MVFQTAIPPPEGWTTQQIIWVFIWVVLSAVGTGFVGNYLINRRNRKDKLIDDEQARREKVREEQDKRDEAKRLELLELDKDIDQRVLNRLAYQDELLNVQREHLNQQHQEMLQLERELIKTEREHSLALAKLAQVEGSIDLIMANAKELADKYNKCMERDLEKDKTLSAQHQLIVGLGKEMKHLSDTVERLQQRLGEP